MPVAAKPLVPPAAPTAPAMSTSPLQQFTDVWTRENATTRRVIAALSAEQAETRPHERSKTAREIVAIFSRSNGRIAAALDNKWQWPPEFPSVSTNYADVVAEFDATSDDVRRALATVSESRLLESVPFLTAPRQVGNVPIVQLLWFMLLDSVHHRGQLSVYLRIAGAKVPSIYGPSADEPWM